MTEALVGVGISQKKENEIRGCDTYGKANLHILVQKLDKTGDDEFVQHVGSLEEPVALAKRHVYDAVHNLVLGEFQVSPLFIQGREQYNGNAERVMYESA